MGLTRHFLVIGVDESSHERAGHVELVDRIGIGRPTAVVEVETWLEHEVDVAREADIGLQTGSYVQTVARLSVPVARVVEADSRQGVDPEASLGPESAEGIVQVEHIVETGTYGTHTSRVVLHEGGGVEVQTKCVAGVDPLAERHSHAHARIVVPVADVGAAQEQGSCLHAGKESVGKAVGRGEIGTHVAPARVGHTDAQTHGEACHRAKIAPGLRLRHVVLRHAHTCLCIDVGDGRESILSAQTHVSAEAVVVVLVLTRIRQVDAGNAVHLEGMLAVVSAGLGDGGDVEQIVEAHGGVFRLLAADFVGSAIEVEPYSVFGRDPVAQAHLGDGTQLDVVAAHEIASETEIHEQMVHELLVLVRLGDLWALQHIVESALRELRLTGEGCARHDEGAYEDEIFSFHDDLCVCLLLFIRRQKVGHVAVALGDFLERGVHGEGSF